MDQPVTPETRIDLDQLDRYFAGELSPAEAHRMRRWLNGNRETADQIATLRTVWAPTKAGDLDIDAAWLTLRDTQSDAKPPAAKQPAAKQPEVGRRMNKPRTHTIATTWPVAAGLAIIAIFLFALRVPSEKTTNGKEFSAAVNAYTTPNAQRAVVTLLDGTKVTLNVASHLEVPSDFGRNNRTVHLIGEAYFDVAHAPGTPFIVKTSNTQTRVLGTRFVVRHYAGDTAANIAVRDGRVAVGDVVLGAEEQVLVGARGVSAIHPTDATRFSFASGLLTLRPTTLIQAIDDLNRWYDVDIRLADPSLGRVKIEGQYAAGSIADLSERLEWGYHFRAVREGRILTLYPR